MVNCSECGTELDFREAFCSKCGEVTDRGKGPGELARRYTAELVDGFGKLIAAAFAYVTNSDNRKKVGIGVVVALVLMISLTSNPILRSVDNLFTSSPDGPAFNEDGTPNFADYEDQFLSFEAEYLVTGAANIREFPTSQGTSIVGSFEGGERITAREVRAFDPNSRWYAIEGGGYVWGANLTSAQRGQSEAQASETVAWGPEDILGRWSDRATCYGEIRDIEFEVTPEGLLMNDQLHVLTYEGANGTITFATTEPDPADQFLIAVDRSDRAAVLLVSFPRDMSPKEYPFYPIGTSCSDRPRF